MSKIIFYYGSMSSGKSIDLLQTAYKYNSTGKKVIIMKPAIDTKGNDFIVSRIGIKKKVDVLLKKGESVFNYLNILKGITCLLVDEVQFLTEKQVLELFYLAKEINIPVICYGLKTDFQGRLFSGSEALFRYADSFEKLKAVCITKNCPNNAAYNARKVDGKYVFEGSQIFIGVDNEYDHLCAECYIKNVLKPYSKIFHIIDTNYKKQTNEKKD